MDIFKDDLIKNKYFLLFVAFLLIIGAFFYLKDYNSVENQCRRKIEKTGSYIGPANKLQEGLLQSVQEQMIRECIKNESSVDQ